MKNFKLQTPKFKQCTGNKRQTVNLDEMNTEIYNFSEVWFLKFEVYKPEVCA